MTFTVPTINANNTIIALEFGSFDAGLRMAGVQLEYGSTATPFQTATGTIQGELALAQRYYWRAGQVAAFQRYGNGVGAAATTGYCFVNTPVPMRVSPTSVDFSNLGVYDGTSTIALTSVAINIAAPNGTELTCTAASGITANRPLILTNNNSTSGFVAFNSEL